MYNNERQPLHLQDSLRHTDAQRLKAYHVSCLEATDANAAGRVSASWMHAAHLRSSGPMPPADDRFELYASNVLSAAMGSCSTRHFADGSPAAQALEALRVPGVLDYVAVQVAAAMQHSPPDTGAHLWPPAAAVSSIPAADAAAAHAAQAASRQGQREALHALPSGAQQPAVAALMPGFPTPWLLNSALQLPAPPPDAAALAALFAALPRTAVANAGQPGNAGLPAAATATPPAHLTNQGGAGVAKKCSLCQQPRKGTHQHGCPTHCKACKQPHAACSCGA